MIQLLSRYVAIATTGLLVLALGGWKAGSWILPRPLIPGHAVLNDCGICHPGFWEGPSGWVLRAVGDADKQEECMRCHREDEEATSPRGLLRWLSMTAGDGGMQNEKCLKCHRDAAEASSPHGLSQAEIGTLAQRRREKSRDVKRVRLAPSAAHVPITIACASCHDEHQGRQANLTILSNEKCQACHQTAFDSLVDGHPDFGNYPFRRRAKIVFDHTAHLTRNFEKAGLDRAPKGCTGCHFVDALGRKMLALTFEQTCQNCHDGHLHGDKRDTDASGIEFLTVPGLDANTLRTRGIDIGEWPSRSEQTITPFMEIILRSDPEAAAALEVLRGVDLLDLENETDLVVESAAKLAWRVKSLIAELRAAGPRSLIQEIEAATDKAVAREKRAALVASIPADVIISAQRVWFPNLEADLSRHAAGARSRTVDVSPISRGEARGSSNESWTELGGWFRDDYAISYRPVLHRDPFMVAWMDLAAEMGRARPGADLLDLMRRRTAPGGCGKCHSVDILPDGRRFVNWKAGHERTDPVGFTRFAHSPHFSITRSDCTHCHPPASRSNDVVAQYESGDPTSFVAEFEPVARATCARCHDGQAATDLCTSCHYYHVARNRAPGIVAAARVKPNAR